MIPKHLVRHILIIRPDAIGDLILTIPAIMTIKKHYPKAKISLLASPYNAKLLYDFDIVDHIIEYSPRATCKSFSYLRTLFKKEHIDVAIHYGIRPEVAWACFFSIPYNIGDKAHLSLWPIFRKYGIFYRNHDRMKHFVEYNHVLLKQLGIHFEEATPFKLKPHSKHLQKTAPFFTNCTDIPLIGIQMGVGHGNRPVTPQKYASYITLLQKKIPCNICLWYYSEKEKEACKIVQSLIPKTPIIIGRLSLPEFIGLLSQLTLFVGVDTGPSHIATALGIPQLAIFPSKKVKPLTWGPFRNRHFIIRENTNCNYDCPHEHCPYDICSDDINETEMVDRTMDLLNGKGYTEKEEQRLYWAQKSLNQLILYDKNSKKSSQKLFEQLKKWNMTVFLKPACDSDLFSLMRENDIFIVYNLSKKRNLRFFLMNQRLIKYLHFSPLWLAKPLQFKSLPDWYSKISSQYQHKYI